MKKIVLVLLVLAVLLGCANCVNFDGFIRNLHNVPADGVYETKYTTVRFHSDSEHWAVADVVAENADKLVVNSFRALKIEPKTLHFEIVIISDADFSQYCPKTVQRIYTENLEIIDKACTIPDKKITYLVGESLREDTLVHEIVHQVANSLDEKAAEEISLNVWR